MTTVNVNTFNGPNDGVDYVTNTVIASSPMNVDLNRVEADLDYHVSVLQAIYDKLDTIETSAKDDQTAAEIVALINASAELLDVDNLNISTYVGTAIDTDIEAHRTTTTDSAMHTTNSIRDSEQGYDATPIALETTPANLTDEINNIRRVIKVLVGKTTWTGAPSKTIEELAALFNVSGEATPEAHASRHITGGDDTIANAQSGGSSGLMSGADKQKLDAIEVGATADQTAAEIRTLVNSATDSNVYTDADKAKLNGIETNATADQTAAEIRTLVDAATDSNVFTDTYKTKLIGIQSNATNTQEFNVVEKTTNYTATLTDYVILCNATSAAITITLPAVASSAKQIYQIKKIDSSANAVTIDANSTELIDNNQTFDLVVQNEALTLYCTGTKWVIL